MQISVGRAGIRQGLKEMRDNADYILAELPGLNVSSSWKQRIKSECEKFLESLNEINKKFEVADQHVRQFMDTPTSIAAHSALKLLQDGLSEFRQPLSEIHDLVVALKDLPQEDSILYLLVAESASNILSAEERIRSGATDITSAVKLAVDSIPNGPSQADGSSSSSDLKWLSLPCGLCARSETIDI